MSTAGPSPATNGEKTLVQRGFLHVLPYLLSGLAAAAGTVGAAIYKSSTFAGRPVAGMTYKSDFTGLHVREYSVINVGRDPLDDKVELRVIVPEKRDMMGEFPCHVSITPIHCNTTSDFKHGDGTLVTAMQEAGLVSESRIGLLVASPTAMGIEQCRVECKIGNANPFLITERELDLDLVPSFWWPLVWGGLASGGVTFLALFVWHDWRYSRLMNGVLSNNERVRGTILQEVKGLVSSLVEDRKAEQARDAADDLETQKRAPKPRDIQKQTKDATDAVKNRRKQSSQKDATATENGEAK